MNRNGQTLIISLWILAALTILAVGIGHRVSIALRLSRYQRDRLKALELAKAGLNRAIIELERDTNTYDALDEPWANNEEVFKKIVLDDEQNDFASVSYEGIDEHNNPQTIYGAMDEESKININSAPSALLTELLNKAGVINPPEITNNICAWRGDSGISIPDYTDLGYSNKGNKFINKEELMLIKALDREIYDKLKYLVTVWGYGKVNINTTSKEILEALIEYCKKQIAGTENDPQDLVDRIIRARPANSFSDLQGKLSAQISLSSGQINILNELQKVGDFKSSCFYIQSSGKINNNKRAYTIDSVFDRKNKKIMYWHER